MVACKARTLKERDSENKVVVEAGLYIGGQIPAVGIRLVARGLHAQGRDEWMGEMDRREGGRMGGRDGRKGWKG